MEQNKTALSPYHTIKTPTMPTNIPQDPEGFRYPQAVRDDLPETVRNSELAGRILHTSTADFPGPDQNFPLLTQGLYGVSPREFVDPPPPLTWRAALHPKRAMLVSDNADAQQNAFASVFFHEAAPMPGDHNAFFPHNEAGTEVVKQKCAWHAAEVVSKKDYIHLWTGGNGSVSFEARKENKKQHIILFKRDVFAIKKLCCSPTLYNV